VQIFQREQGLPADSVRCIAEDAQGNLYLGTQEGIVGYNGEEYFSLPGTEKLKGKEITGLFMDSKERLWIALGDGRLYVHAQQGTQLVSSALPLQGALIRALAEDRKGRVWFGSRWGKGCGYFANGQAQMYTEKEGPSWIGALEDDGKGSVWIGSASSSVGNGLYRYKGTSFELVRAFPGAAILALEQSQHALWVGTNEGLYGFDGKQWQLFTARDGLPCEIITALYQGADGALWIGTEGGGVCCCDGKVFQSIEISGEPERNVIYAMHRDAAGRIWLATEGGLIQYSPRKSRPWVAVNKVVADEEYHEPEKVSATLKGGRLSFHLQGKSEIDTAACLLFRYRLEGYDETWRQTRDRKVEYFHLEPGKYAFKVQAIDCDLNYSETAQVWVKIRKRRRQIIRVKAPDTPSIELIGKSPAWQRVQGELGGPVVQSDISLLLLGETGTGKSAVARTIHRLSARKAGPFVQVNCGAVPAGLVETAFFGHEKGSFTGAIARRIGAFEQARGGTLFLDEIGDLSLEAQTALLHVLEDKIFQRVGGQEKLRADARLITATNQDLHQAVQEGRFRADLYYRIHAYPIPLPPLRARREDIPLLAEHFIRKAARQMKLEEPRLSRMALRQLLGHDWPGNVRELEHVLQRAVILAKTGQLEPHHLELGPRDLVPGENGNNESVFLPMRDVEIRYLRQVLRHTRGRIYGPEGAAALIGMHPDTLRSRLIKLGLKE
jgi:DNA-binding NtrC family response regulator